MVPELERLLLILILELADDAVLSRFFECEVGGQDPAIIFQRADLLRLVRGDYLDFTYGLLDGHAAIGCLEIDHDVVSFSLILSHVHAGQAHHLEFCIDGPF